MQRYEKSQITPGLFMIKDGGPAIGAPIRKSTPRGPVRYGEPLDTDFKAISQRLDAARGRLDEIAKVYRNARRA